jgi:hypothetical protein
MNNVKFVPDIGPKPVLKYAVAHNAMEVGSFVGRPLGKLRLSLFNERRKKGGRSTFYFCEEMKKTNHRQNHTYV